MQIVGKKFNNLIFYFYLLLFKFRFSKGILIEWVPVVGYSLLKRNAAIFRAHDFWPNSIWSWDSRLWVWRYNQLSHTGVILTMEPQGGLSFWSKMLEYYDPPTFAFLNKYKPYLIPRQRSTDWAIEAFFFKTYNTII